MKEGQLIKITFRDQSPELVAKFKSFFENENYCQYWVEIPNTATKVNEGKPNAFEKPNESRGIPLKLIKRIDILEEAS